jgi:uncharacterized protein (TIRG00374 family)
LALSDGLLREGLQAAGGELKNHWKAIGGIAVSSLLIWWALRGVDVGQVWREVREANGWLLLASVTVATSAFLLRALRWKVLLRPIRRGTSLSHRFVAVNIGFAVNNLLPARVGEFARAWTISRLEPVSVSAAVGSLVAERFLDGLAIFVLLFLAVIHPSFPAEATVAGRPVGETVTAILVVVAVAIAGLAVLLTFPAIFIRIAHRLGQYLPGKSGHAVAEILEAFLVGLDSLRRPGLLFPALACSFPESRHPGSSTPPWCAR